MKAKVSKILIPVLVIIFALQSCERPKEKAVGYDQVITVLCDDANWEACEPVLAETLGKIYKTPRTETLYIFKRINADDLDLNKMNKNILVLTNLEVYSEITPQVQSMLPDSTIRTIRENPRGYYYQEDAYAQGQALVIVVGKSISDLQGRLQVNQDQIFNFIEHKMYERNTAFVYRSGEQFELAESYFEEHGYYLRMMHDYVEIENHSEKKLVWLGRDFPYRWLTISWETPNDSSELEVQLDELLRKTFQRKLRSSYDNELRSVRLKEDHLSSESFWFKQYSAYKYFGLWESIEEVKGGPFIAYGFYEPVKDRIYLLTGIIHAPHKDKIPYLRQMETIFRTFDTKTYEPE